jgi:ABC-type sugar transport system permease subunit
MNDFEKRPEDEFDYEQPEGYVPSEEAPEEIQEEFQEDTQEYASEAAYEAPAPSVNVSAKVEALRSRRLAKHEAKVRKQFDELDKAEAREKAKTNDPTAHREIELLAEQRRKELERSSAQEARVIASSTGSKLSYEGKKAMYGYGFIAIWVLGIIFIFIGPLITSVRYSFSNTTLVSATEAAQYDMNTAGIHLEWNSFAHYNYAFTTDPNYTVALATSLSAMIPQVLMILIFSLFVAVLLNQKFKGRTLLRAIFFFPVLIATGPVIAVINGSIMSQGIGGDAAQFSTMFQTDMVEGFMQFLGLYNISQEFSEFISNTTSNIFNLLWKSGIQILIFLSALQQIPTAAKEAASMEGATAWEFFWKITFPTISPMILANLIYTIIDNFSDSQNLVMNQVLEHAKNFANIPGTGAGYASALAWVYFGIIAIALAVVVGIVSRFVFYQVD